MRTIAAAVAVVLALAVAVAAAPQDRPHSQGDRVVTMSGQSEVSMAPDQARVTVGIEARAPKPQEAQQRAAEVMTRVHAQLAALGIPESAIRTVSFNLDADWSYANNKRTLRGYIVTNLVEVRVDDLAKVADVLDRSIASGGNAIHGVRWDIKDREQVERAALRQAVEDAKQRAEVAVTAAGARLGPVVAISEQRMYDQPQGDMMLQRAEVAGDASTPISPGELRVRSTVTVSFRIE